MPREERETSVLVASGSRRRSESFASVFASLGLTSSVIAPQLDENDRRQRFVLDKGIDQRHPDYTSQVALAKLGRLAENHFQHVHGEDSEKEWLVVAGDTVQRYQDYDGVWRALDKPANVIEYVGMALMQSGRPVCIESAVAANIITRANPVSGRRNGRLPLVMYAPGIVMSRVYYNMREFTIADVLAYLRREYESGNFGILRLRNVAGGLSFMSHMFEDQSRPLRHEVHVPRTGELIRREEYQWSETDTIARRNLVYGGFPDVLQAVIGEARAMRHQQVLYIDVMREHIGNIIAGDTNA